MDMRERIKAVIAEKPGMTVRSVSLEAGLSDSMLHKFLSGQTDSMTIKTAQSLAKALAVDPRWLIFGEGDPDEATDASNIFKLIPPEHQELAMQVLRGFLRTGTDG